MKVGPPPKDTADRGVARVRIGLGAGIVQGRGPMLVRDRGGCRPRSRPRSVRAARLTPGGEGVESFPHQWGLV